MSLRDISPKGQTQEQSESHAGQSKCSGAVVLGQQDSGKLGCSGLLRLSGDTRLHFPIREAAKDKQLDCRIPHIPSISIIHTICSICVNTTWHHNITLQLKYLFIRLRGARYYKHGSHDPTFGAYKSKYIRKLNLSEYRQLKMKKAEEPDYIPDPPKGTRSQLR